MDFSKSQPLRGLSNFKNIRFLPFKSENNLWQSFNSPEVHRE